MTGLFPEQPVLFYPSLAQRFGVEEALLLSVYHEFSRHHGMVDQLGQPYFLARRMEWQNMAPFWSEEQLATLTNSLVSQHAISAEFNANGSIRVVILDKAEQEVEETTLAPTPQPETMPAQSKAYQAIQESHSTPDSMLTRGPAPSFGGSTGWSRPKDDLERLFDQQEKRNQKLHEIDLDWRPCATTYQMLSKHSIPKEFADDQLDEFVAYWLAQNKKKTSWDSPFIDHVKRKWVREQSRKGRANAAKVDQNSEDYGERYQPNNRAEKRERITEAVMDIKNIDW